MKIKWKQGLNSGFEPVWIQRKKKVASFQSKLLGIQRNKKINL